MLAGIIVPCSFRESEWFYPFLSWTKEKEKEEKEEKEKAQGSESSKKLPSIWCVCDVGFWCNMCKSRQLGGHDAKDWSKDFRIYGSQSCHCFDFNSKVPILIKFFLIVSMWPGNSEKDTKDAKEMKEDLVTRLWRICFANCQGDFATVSLLFRKRMLRSDEPKDPQQKSMPSTRRDNQKCQCQVFHQRLFAGLDPRRLRGDPCNLENESEKIIPIHCIPLHVGTWNLSMTCMTTHDSALRLWDKVLLQLCVKWIWESHESFRCILFYVAPSQGTWSMRRNNPCCKRDLVYARLQFWFASKHFISLPFSVELPRFHANRSQQNTLSVLNCIIQYYSHIRTHTHTYTNIYVYIYIYAHIHIFGYAVQIRWHIRTHIARLTIFSCSLSEDGLWDKDCRAQGQWEGQTFLDLTAHERGVSPWPWGRCWKGSFGECVGV